ncbi:uncharacterized protein LY89DRAFT_684778 [Mollisia scopiformis]|uniref:Uncharacterized protein n=1 Tax=Mollisia scopiformis TaxID=149040 RepID=A0A194X936_MOLSC|nr:uncharacterized protein LY89DRAFT_684778 [Mollisia scopiformis]KUJ16683.1 hypothetical protein LY89DRAFT_684778 [Mollisia scopiformis]
MVRVGPPTGSVDSTSSTSPTCQILIRHELIRLEKRLVWAKRMVQRRHDLGYERRDKEMQLLVQKVSHLESFIRDRFSLMRALLPEQQRQDQIEVRLEEFETLHDDLAFWVDVADRVTDTRPRAGRWTPHQNRITPLEHKVGFQRLALLVLMDAKEKDEWNGKVPI